MIQVHYCIVIVVGEVFESLTPGLSHEGRVPNLGDVCFWKLFFGNCLMVFSAPGDGRGGISPVRDNMQ